MNYKRAMMVALTAAILVVALTAIAVAEVPQLINYQGRLTLPDGTVAADGTYDISFGIFD